MRYRRPFTAEQRRDAAAVYRSCRRNYRTLRREHAPRNRNEQAILRDYRAMIKEFGLEAAKRDRDVSTELLSDLASDLIKIVGEYYLTRLQ
ncbi:MAG: hypothetical protein H7X80_10605 [bacterium]|nr:hypothetical protein [Candidatus Kapabacteria bacterium]